MNILCRLGLHKWKPVMRVSWGYMLHLTATPSVFQSPLRHISNYVTQTGHQCRRCGKRVKL